MYSYPIAQADPLVNAFLQTLLLVLCPLSIAFLVGGALSLWLFFRRHPLLAGKQRPFGRAHWARHTCPFLCLGLSPLVYLLLNRFLGLPVGAAMVLLLSLCAAVYLGVMMYGAFGKLDASILETALASGLNHSQLIHLVLWPAGKMGLGRVLCQTSLFLLATSSVAGCLAGGGLIGLAVQSAGAPRDIVSFILCLLLLALLFLLPGWLCSRLTGRPEK